MSDSIGNIPTIESEKDALKQILGISKDDRHHILADDEIQWLELKMRTIRKIAKKGLKIAKRKEFPPRPASQCGKM